MNEWLIANKELISIYGSIFQTIGSILVPIVLAIWGIYSEKQKDIRAKRKEDKEYIHNYIKEKLEPFIFNNYNFEVEKEDDEEKYSNEIKNCLHMCSIELVLLQRIIESFSYSYMIYLFNWLESLAKKVIKSKNLSVEELNDFFISFSVGIRFILPLLQLDENQYQYKEVIFIHSFIETEGKIRNIMLEVLENDYKAYHKHAINYIEELEKK